MLETNEVDCWKNADMAQIVKGRPSLSRQHKFSLLKSHFRPGDNYVFPKTKQNFKMRSFQASWLKTYPWLAYSESEDGGYCKCCVLLAHLASNITTGALVKLPMKNWNKAMDILKDHQKKEYHTTASLRADDFLQTAERPETSITSIIDNEAARHIAKNRKLLRSIISCIVFCGKQNIALRGHNESLSDEGNNPGNFLALLKFRAEAGDDVLAIHLNEATDRAKYTSATIQKELISIIGGQLRKSIVGQITDNAPFYSILADEVTDVANKEQLSLVVHFVDIDGTIHNEFLGFLSLERITGEAIASAILNILPKWNLNIKNCRGQGYDWASSMSSVCCGTQAHLLEECPLAVYTHCRAHCLNLPIVHSCDQPLIRNMLGTLKETCNLFKYSPK